MSLQEQIARQLFTAEPKDIQDIVIQGRIIEFTCYGYLGFAKLFKNDPNKILSKSVRCFNERW